MAESVQGTLMQGREAPSLPAGLLSTLLELVDDAVVVIDARRAIVLFNRGAERVFHYRAAEVLGEPVTLILPAFAAIRRGRRIDAFGEQAASTRGRRTRSEIAGRRSGGAAFVVEASISRVAIGGLRYDAAVVRDLGERRRVDPVPAAREAGVRTLPAGAPAGIFQIDVAGACAYVVGHEMEL